MSTRRTKDDLVKEIASFNQKASHLETLVNQAEHEAKQSKRSRDQSRDLAKEANRKLRDGRNAIEQMLKVTYSVGVFQTTDWVEGKGQVPVGENTEEIRFLRYLYDILKEEQE